MKDEMKEEKLFMCECSGEILCVTKFDNDTEYWFSLYSHGEINKAPSIINRVKYAWHHIKTGKKYADMIILSEEKAIELSNFIIPKNK